jgi:hypothetical protein
MGHMGFVHLVSDEANAAVMGAEPLGRFAVKRHQAFACIHDEKDQGSLLHRVTDLTDDVVAEIIAVDDAVTPGIHEVEEQLLVEIAHGRNAVAGDARRGFDDAGAPTDERIEEAAFPNVGATHNGDQGQRHHEDDSVIPCSPP